MAQLPVPLWGADQNNVPGNLASNFTLDFTKTNTYNLDTTSQYLGYDVSVKSCVINNSGNTSAVQVNLGGPTGTSIYISQNSLGVADISGAKIIQFVCNNPVVIQGQLFNYVSSQGSQNITFQNSTTDPVGFSNVYGLYHFQGIEGQNVFIDNANYGFGLITATYPYLSIDTSNTYNGLATSLKMTPNLSYPASSPNTKTMGSQSTYECFVYMVMAGSEYQFLQQGDMAIIATDNGGANWSLGIDGPSADPIGGAISYNSWHHIAVVNIGTFTVIYLDGNLYDSATTGDAPYGNFTIYPSCTLWMNELRITNLARYQMPFTIPTVPFPNM